MRERGRASEERRTTNTTLYCYKYCCSKQSARVPVVLGVDEQRNIAVSLNGLIYQCEEHAHTTGKHEYRIQQTTSAGDFNLQLCTWYDMTPFLYLVQDVAHTYFNPHSPRIWTFQRCHGAAVHVAYMPEYPIRALPWPLVTSTWKYQNNLYSQPWFLRPFTAAKMTQRSMACAKLPVRKAWADALENKDATSISETSVLTP